MDKPKTCNIVCKYEGFGWIAKSVEAPGFSTIRCNGPRAAAENLANQIFGKGLYHLTRKAGVKWYLATPLNKD